MDRTYVFYYSFIAMALAGAGMLLGVAGGSDLGLFTTGEVFLYGTLSLALSALGIWGFRVCGAALRARRARRAARLTAVAGGDAGRAA